MSYDPQRVTQALEDLLAAAPRSQMARLRELLDKVEAAFARGVRREAVLQALNENGFSLTLSSFDTYLRRLRAERKAGGTSRTQRRAPAAILPPPADGPPPDDPDAPLTLKDALDPVKRAQRADKFFGPAALHRNSLAEQIARKREEQKKGK